MHWKFQERTRQPNATPLLMCSLLMALAAQMGFAQNEGPNLIPNPGFAGDSGLVIGTTGTVPDLWRGFAVAGGAAQIDIEALPANSLFAGSPAINAVRLTVTNPAGDQGFDHEDTQFALESGHGYQARVYMKSGNAGGASQTVSVGFPVFENGAFTGRSSGSFVVDVGDTWQLYSGPVFNEVDGTTADVSFRAVGGGSVLIALPTVSGPSPGYPPIFTTGREYGSTDPYVSTSFFHWYTSSVGQVSGPWRPLEGRDAWTGNAPFWRRQIKDVMDAGIDVLYVHLLPVLETQRIELFRALTQLRAEGYDVPKVAPFLDTVLTWGAGPIDLATAAGKDALAAQYTRWYEQYFSASPDAFAASFLLRVDGRAAMDSWWLLPTWTQNLNQWSRADLESRMQAAFPTVFQNGVYFIGTETGSPAWADERIHQFSNTAYFSDFEFDGVRTGTLKAGYWDQNIRFPGIFLPRDGGTHYIDAWNDLNATAAGSPPIYHAYIESWNEYDEGSGIYSGDPGPPYIDPFNTSGNDDSWSVAANPREYIDTTAAGAAVFRADAGRDAMFLWNDIPATMVAGETRTLRLVVRNEGSEEWSGADDHNLGQNDTDTFIFGTGRHPVDDVAAESSVYGGVFKGRPILFEIEVTAPAAPGEYEFNWQMVKDDESDFFGETLTTTILVDIDSDGDGMIDTSDNCTLIANPDQDDSDGDGIGNRCDADIANPNNCLVDLNDLAAMRIAFLSTSGTPNWNPDADFDNNGAIDLSDLSILRVFFLLPPGPAASPNEDSGCL
ncbi:MAG: hypothetical protein HKN06_10075 [Gammaproteobacteria bacterium]|nr:hypothetical protein [Gammaproteobacteria bacterium]